MRSIWSVVSELILDLICGLKGPKTDFWPFSLYWRKVNIMPNDQGICRLACRPRFIFGLEYHPYICHVPGKILKNPKNTYLGLYISYISQRALCAPPRPSHGIHMPPALGLNQTGSFFLVFFGLYWFFWGGFNFDPHFP